MSAYWITFRLNSGTVQGRSYDVRYEALTEAVRLNASQWWRKPTAFIAFASDHNIETLANVCKRAIAPSHDMFLIRAMDRQSAIICGLNDDQDIFKLMPYLQPLT
jgi:hypothetical protein